MILVIPESFLFCCKKQDAKIVYFAYLVIID